MQPSFQPALPSRFSTAAPNRQCIAPTAASACRLSARKTMISGKSTMGKLIVTEKAASETHYEYAERILYNNIMSLVLAPGEVLSDIDIANELRISRTPVREAFVNLRFQRLVDTYPQKHTCVSKINLDYVDEGIYFRHVFECNILPEVIEKSSSADLARLKDLIDKQYQAIQQNDNAGFLKWDFQFHSTMFDIVEKPWCWSTIQQITTHHNRVCQLVISLGDNNAEMLIPYNEHCKIFDMIVSRAIIPDIKTFMLKHIGYRRLLPDLFALYPDYFVR